MALVCSNTKNEEGYMLGTTQKIDYIHISDLFVPKKSKSSLECENVLFYKYNQQETKSKYEIRFTKEITISMLFPSETKSKFFYEIKK